MAEKGLEFPMGTFIRLIRGTFVTFHTVLLHLEMGINVGFQKIDQSDDEFALLAVGIGRPLDAF
jgi:hypothetical protein